MESESIVPYFKEMTLKEAWEGEFDPLFRNGMPKDMLESLREICSMKFLTPLDVYAFLPKHDSLVESIYHKHASHGRDGCYFYPPAPGVELPEGVKTQEGPIGIHRSSSGDESLQDHVAYVAQLLCKGAVFTEPECAYVAAIHDIGKKYTAATTGDGKGIFFPEHAALSAFIAGHWLRTRRKLVPDSKQFPTSDKELVALIYAHEFPNTLWNKEVNPETCEEHRQKFWKDLLPFLGETHVRSARIVMEDIRVFSVYDDKGIFRNRPSHREGIDEAVSRGITIIYNLSRNLPPT